jgi:hypothetical protein
MNYLNISTQMMGESEAAGAEPLEIGIWIRLTLYSIDQENGGIIANSREWNDRKWRNICRISAEEANVVSELFWFVGDDLHLWNYPMESEEKVASKREAGKRGGKARSEAKVNAAKANGLKSVDTCLGGGPSTIEKCLGGGQAETEVASGTPKHNGNGNGKRNGKRNGNEKDNGEGEGQSEAEAEEEAPIPSDATADPGDAHTALRAVADLGVEYFLSLKADPTYKALDLQLEAGTWHKFNTRSTSIGCYWKEIIFIS